MELDSLFSNNMVDLMLEKKSTFATEDLKMCHRIFKSHLSRVGDKICACSRWVVRSEAAIYSQQLSKAN